MKKDTLKVVRSASFTLFFFGLLGWLYIVGAAYVHPETLPIHLTHYFSWPREDTFGMICFVVSFLSFFVWNMAREHH